MIKKYVKLLLVGDDVMKDKKVLFMGTPLFAVNVLEALILNTTVVGVVTQPDKEVGRKRVLTPPVVKVVAEDHGIKVFQPRKIKEDYKDILDLDFDIIVTCAYGQMIPDEVLFYPKYKTINVHASLLPKYRGGAPISRAIMNGEEKTGITIMKTDSGMDTGNIVAKEEILIEDSDNLSSLSDKLSRLGANLLIKTLPSIFDGSCVEEVQNEEDASIAKLIKKEDEHISFKKNATYVFNHIRALAMEPGGYMILDGVRIKIFDSYINDVKVNESSVISNIYKDGIGISCLDKEIVVTKLQVPGKKAMSARDYLNGKSKDELLGKIVQ